MIGTMIEIPRVALTADRVATQAEFFSFGTNDLTQTTMGISHSVHRADLAFGYPRSMELIFEVRDAEEGGFHARAWGPGIFTEGKHLIEALLSLFPPPVDADRHSVKATN
jgi:hypothetical protein